MVTNLVMKQDRFNSLDENNVGSFDTYTGMIKYYEANHYWGLLASIDARSCNAEFIRSADAIKKYVVELCDLIQMKRFQETCVVNFGEDEKVAGYSMIQLIETSLISGHFANLTNNAYIDIFSCKVYDPYQAADFTKQFFGASDVSVNIYFRK